MIRADRRHLVCTLADLATAQGIRPHTYINARYHLALGFPAPISSAGSRTRLYDAEQVDAYFAGKPIPPLPTQDDGQDLLDRRECATALGISPRTWDKYKTTYPALTEHLATVGGVEHWPRSILHQYQAQRPVKATTTGRPAHTGDQVPRDQMLPRTAPLLDADPAISAAAVVEALGVHRDTAQDALTCLRAERMAELLNSDASLTPEQAAVTLGYPAGQVRRATLRARAILRARGMAPYLADVGRAVHRAGWTARAAVPEIHHPAVDVVVAVLTLDGPQPPAPALVWDERHGWRTATSRRHPLTRGAAPPPPGDGIRYLTDSTTPPPGALIAALSS
ncbi:hypothetical protein [Streptomyces sp. NPDC086010]|uniref:hypothetical protein n=1 Tax=Streptomyces sp. NPDC086010 TaxID=3365745 RepID=UPI0037D87B87